MSIHTATEFVCGSWQRRSVTVQATEQQLTSDTGLLLFGQFDQKLGWTEQFVDMISDPRSDPTHSALSIVRQRVFGILAGYEDQNDHDTLRSDPVFKLLAGRDMQQEDLASQPTISRLENSLTASDLLKMEKWFIEKFVESFASQPEQITLDIDTYADSAYGAQQLTFWHDFYKQNQYQVRVLTCAENDMVVLPGLLFGCAVAKLGAADEIRTVIEAIRERFPDVPIHLRADSGFVGEDIYSTIESFAGATYSIGMRLNSKTKRLSQSLYQETIEAQQSSGQSELRYMAITDYQSKKWSRTRQVVIKCEATSHSTSRRVVISNRTELAECPEAVYREYAQRGESENRNKELKCGLFADRLSDHRYMANLFRLMMHCVSHNLLVRLREQVADHSPQQALENEEESQAANRSFAESSQNRKRHNDRRKRDRLGEGHPCTWRTHVIKVAARIVVSTRRLVLQVSASWPHLKYFREVAEAIARYDPQVA